MVQGEIPPCKLLGAVLTAVLVSPKDVVAGKARRERDMAPASFEPDDRGEPIGPGRRIDLAVVGAEDLDLFEQCQPHGALPGDHSHRLVALIE